MKINTDSKKIDPSPLAKGDRVDELLGRGVEDIIDKKSLAEKLKSGKKLRIKHGIDPTGTNLHIGRAFSYWKLKKFQELGHQVVIIIGDFTARIGDASDKQAMRKPLSESEIKENMKNYKKQLGRILDMDKVELRYNSEWFNKFTMKEMMAISMHFTAQQMIQRTNFKERWEKKKPIGVHELGYPLLQGYDSVAVKADVEVGGFDQLFNLLVGRDVQKIYKQPLQDIITFKLLYGLDGRKMSTSWGNVINVLDSPKEQYGKVMSMKDELIINYFELATDVPIKEINKIEKDLKKKKLNPRDAKARLAREIVKLYYSESEAEKAEKEFDRIFKEKKVPSKIPIFIAPKDEYQVLYFLVWVNLAKSKGEARRLIEQKGIKITKETKNKKRETKIIESWQGEIKMENNMIVQAGKRKFVKIIRS